MLSAKYAGKDPLKKFIIYPTIFGGMSIVTYRVYVLSVVVVTREYIDHRSIRRKPPEKSLDDNVGTDPIPNRFVGKVSGK